MAFKIAYWGLLASVTFGLVYVYFNRLEIPLTLAFENLLDAKIKETELQRSDLARAIVNFEAEQREEREYRQIAKSNSYSSPFRALSAEWYKFKIILLNILHFFCTYRVIIYIAFFLLILYMTRVIFWRYYAL